MRRYKKDDGCLFQFIIGIVSIIIALIFKLNVIVAFFYTIGAVLALSLIGVGLVFSLEKIADLFKKKNYSTSDNTPIDSNKTVESFTTPIRIQHTFPSQRNSSHNINNNYLYHFTEPRNIPSIKKYGLLSWEELINRNIAHIPASNDLSRNLDRRYNLGDFVRLSLNQDHPMFHRAINERRVSQLIWLRINPVVMDFPNTLFSNDNATSNRVIINNIKETALNSYSLQAEVLVKKRIDPKYISFPDNVFQSNIINF